MANRCVNSRPARLFLVLAVVASFSVRAAEPQPSDEVLSRQVRHAISQLEDEQFSTRDRAAQRLQLLVDDPKIGPILAEEFSRALLSPETSFEARARLELLAKHLPPASAPAGQIPLPEEIEPLLAQLGSNSNAARDHAGRRLKSMLGHVELIPALLAELKRSLADPKTDAQTRQAIEPMLDKAREAWVLADPARVLLPAVNLQQISQWIEELSQSGHADATDLFRQIAARRELIDLIVRDDTRPQVLELLEKRIAAATDATNVELLRDVADFARPAIAAEVWGHQAERPDIQQEANWEHRQNFTVQHLLVDVPQIPEMAVRATHFDRIDDKTAHCVSGSTLSEGDYPVGVAIPNPNPSLEVMFYLVNLPTPRRRLAYEYLLKRDERQRLLEISQKTLDHFLANKVVLNEGQVMLLAQLDPRAVSKFVGPYFQTVADQPLVTSSSELTGQITLHGGICYMLTRIGTREAVPPLEQTARSGRLGKSSYDSPYQIAWIAALAIAHRDPWPEVDAWLARLLTDGTPLMTNADPAPSLGASAAALLLDRHGFSPRSYGLEPAGEAALERLRFAGYRYTTAEGSHAIERWWEKQKTSTTTRSGP